MDGVEDMIEYPVGAVKPWERVETSSSVVLRRVRTSS